jgi:hypothetical protein
LVFSRVLTLFALAFGSKHACCEPSLFVDLDYQTDEALDGCPNGAAFRAEIQSQLGYDPFRAESPRKVSARAIASSDGIKGLVRWYDAAGTPRGERELTSSSKSCAAFARKLSFAIAVQIQLLNEDAKKSAADAAPEPPGNDPPRAMTEKKPTQPAPTRASEPLEPAMPASGTRPGATGENDPARQFLLGAGAGARLGQSPEAALEGRIFAGVRSHRFALELGADASLPARYSTSEGRGFDQSLAGGSLAGCAFIWPFSGCLVNRWSWIGVRGFGVEMPYSSSGLVAQIGPRATLNGSFGRRWIGVLRIESLVALSSWRVTLREQEVFRGPMLSLAVGFDLVAVFNDNP